MNTNELVTIPLERLIQIASQKGLSGFDVLNLTITVVLGALSLALAYFVFRLSQGFEARSNVALDRIVSLATEVRQMVESGLVNQKDMSNKMLDSILRTNYGESTPANPTSPNDDGILAEKISALVDAKLSKAPTIGRHEIDDIKHAISLLSKAEASADKHVISDHAFRRISYFAQMPAFVVLLNAIVRRGITSLSQLERVRRDECVPAGVERGIARLLTDGILVGTPEKFAINKDIAPDIEQFLDANVAIVEKLKAQYSGRDLDKTVGVMEEEREIAKTLVF